MGQRALLVRVRDQPPILALDIEAEGPFAAVVEAPGSPVTLGVAHPRNGDETSMS